MDAITYSLKAGHSRSDQYYEDIAIFTDEVLAYANRDFGPLIAAFTRFLAETEREEARTPPEYLFELLMLGIFWRVYATKALKLGRLPQRTLAKLAQWHERDVWLKPVVDAVRGALGTLFLTRNGQRSPESPALTLDHLARLLDWLAATGDFDQEIKRLRAWHDFFAVQSPLTRQAQFTDTLAFADWFAGRSEQALGPYTPHVERFLAETHPGYRWREDMIFCGRQRVEYHLNMVGTEIMNRAFRQGFLAAGRKIVLVPPCMRARSADRCQARPTPIGDQCAGCEPGCRVHQVTKLGEKYGFAVFMLPRELAALSPGKSTQQGMAGTGIVGVSCPLTNPQGGWKARAMNLPAQGLLLDYCGCCWHWHLDGGIPTDINFDQLLRLLAIEHPVHPNKQSAVSSTT